LLQQSDLDPDRMHFQLQRLWATLQLQYGAAVKGNTHDWSTAKESRFRSCRTPVLILLYVDWRQWAPLDGAASEYYASASCRLAVQFTVHAVHSMMRSIVRNSSHTSRNNSGINSSNTFITGNTQQQQQQRSWYIQPVDLTAPEGKLKHGTFAGLNWLLRTIGTEQDI
jgi:hypothetical protein